MNMKTFLACVSLMIAASYTGFGQSQSSHPELRGDARATPAYEILVLRKVAVETDLDDLRARFTSDSELVKAKRLELTFIVREMERLQTAKEAALSKLTTTYGDLLLRRVSLEVQLQNLREHFTSDSPDFKRVRTELAVLNRETAKLLN
ncbi:MAG TPA: hypothetical protein VK557_16070 [Pyrinomonadaceae bacterium]|nr:hypothetical protein [Pyrinomonadaceae bacterium]